MSHAYIALLGLWWAFGAYMIYFLGSGSNFPLLNFDHQHLAPLSEWVVQRSEAGHLLNKPVLD